MLVDARSHRAEITSYAYKFCKAAKQANSRTRVTITIPPIMRTKLVAVNKLYIQEMDKSWNPYPDNPVELPVVKASPGLGLMAQQ